MSHRLRSLFFVRLAVVAMTLMVATLSCKGGAKWRRYQPGDAGFSVDLPGTPAESVERSVDLGGVTEVSVVRLERGGGKGMLQVAHYHLIAAAADLPPESLAEIDCLHPFSGSNFVAGAPTPREVAGHPGVVVTGIAPRSASLTRGGWEEDRCVVIGGQMFHLTAIGPDNDASRRDGARFLDSFAVVAK